MEGTPMRLVAGFFVCVTLIVALAVADVHAGQSSGGFSVGVRIVGKGRKPPKKTLAERGGAYTATAAKFTLFKARYGDVRFVSAAADAYWFTARNDGLTYRIAVSRLSGKIIARELIET
jgi:hypothetical protein